MGAVTTGTSIALGTGAFSAAQINNRNANIGVVNDSSALIGLIPNDKLSGIHENDYGELEINLTDPGINVDSIYQFGYLVDSDDDPTDEKFDLLVDEDPTAGDSFKSAFLVANQSDAPTDVQLKIESENTDIGDTTVMFEVHHNGERKGIIKQPGEETTATAELDPGDAFGVSFVVNSMGGEVGDNFSAMITVNAGEAVESESPPSKPEPPGEVEVTGEGNEATVTNNTNSDVTVTIRWLNPAENPVDKEYNVDAGETKNVEAPNPLWNGFVKVVNIEEK